MSTRSSRRQPPISDYALIGDCHSAALVSRDGSIDWCCFHRVDAAPVFARLIDWEAGGHFRIAPTDPCVVKRSYRPDTNVLDTRFITDTGELLLTDCLVMGAETDRHPPHQLLRWLRCERGRVRVGVEFAPRFDYGRTIPRYEGRGDELSVAYGGADALVLQSQVPMHNRGNCSAEGRIELKNGERIFLALSYELPHEVDPQALSTEEAGDRLERTVRSWSRWSATCTYTGQHGDRVRRSALVLKAMSNAPTGAIVAAPTTSLPEEIGGARNWDYRYAWLRDAALNLYALFALGFTTEARAFMAWLDRTTAGRAEDLQILYGVGGERLVPEVELHWVDGYMSSRPVRVGNAAAEQFQLDVYGYLLDTAWLYHRNGGEITPAFWSFLTEIIGVVSHRWTEPDCGIWEVRGEARHYVSSKLLAWVAVDRAIRLARALDLPADLGGWSRLRAAIRERILRDGVDPGTGAFVQSFGDTALDASTLLIPLVRFLPADDRRVLITMDRVSEELAPEGLVYRYLDRDDGLPGTEATFLICSFWLVDNLALAGRLAEAHELFDRLVSQTNDVGLLSEEIDPRTGNFLGNFPQAFSHAGLIGAALNLDRSETSAALK